MFRTTSSRQLVAGSLLALATALGVGAWTLAAQHKQAVAADAAPDVVVVQQTPAPPAPPVTTTATAAAKPAASPAAKPAASPAAKPASASEPVIADGRHPVFITKLDPDGRTVTVDVVQFLTGQAAADAATAAHTESPPPNDYYIRNASTRLRTLEVAPGAPVTVNTLNDSVTGDATKNTPVTLTELRHLLNARDGGALFNVTVSGGKVTSIAEQFLP